MRARFRSLACWHAWPLHVIFHSGASPSSISKLLLGAKKSHVLNGRRAKMGLRVFLSILVGGPQKHHNGFGSKYGTRTSTNKMDFINGKSFSLHGADEFTRDPSLLPCLIQEIGSFAILHSFALFQNQCICFCDIPKENWVKPGGKNSWWCHKLCFLLIVLEFLQAGRISEPFELTLDPFSQDILTSEGFANAVFQTLRLKPGSGCLHAPVCGTWVWMPVGWAFCTVFLGNLGWPLLKHANSNTPNGIIKNGICPQTFPWGMGGQKWQSPCPM